jgi:hypothetical protein
MDKSNASILFSLLSGVALFLFIAYSAIRTLDSSKPDNYFAVSQGVDFHDGILNAPTQTTYAQYEQSDVSIPEYSPDNASYAASGIGKSSEGHGSGYTNNSGGTGSTNKSGGSTESNSGVTVLSMNSRNQEGATEQDAAGTKTSSLTADGSLSGSTTRQSVRKTGNGFGGSNPGGDPTGPAIPVGDGLLFLLLLTGIYALWKSAANIKQQLTTNYFNSFSLKNKNVRA